MRHRWSGSAATLSFAGACTLAALANAAPAAATPRLSEPDRIRLAEVFRLADAVQDSVWPRWSSAPFALLLVTPEGEFLLRHPSPTPDFVACGYDSLLGSNVSWRTRITALPSAFRRWAVSESKVTCPTAAPGEALSPCAMSRPCC